MTDSGSDLVGLLRTSGAHAERELYVRHARRDGRSVVVLRAVDRGASCVVEADVFDTAGEATPHGPYNFADARDATAFMTEAVETLMYLGCDVHAE